MKKDELLEYALDVYTRKPNATVHDVAERAGISKSAVFYHFRNKRELEKELLLYAIRKFSPWEAGLGEAVKSWLRVMKDNPGLSRLFYTLFERLNEAEPGFVKDLCEKSFRKVAEVVEREGIKDSYRVAVLLLALLDGLALYSMYLGVDVTEFEDLVLKMLEGLKNG